MEGRGVSRGEGGMRLGRGEEEREGGWERVCRRAARS